MSISSKPLGSSHGTVLIASDNLLAIWSTFASSANEVLAVPQKDVTAALNSIRRRQPAIVVLEEAFAVSSQAAALIARLHTTAEFGRLQIRLLTADGVAALQAAHAAHADARVSLASITRPMPRRSSRLRPAGPIQIRIDGHPATLVNLSTSGTQVCSSLVLRPHQRVRVRFQLNSDAIRMNGIVVWSAFEMTPTPTYRAGIKLLAAFPLTVEEILAQLTVVS